VLTVVFPTPLCVPATTIALATVLLGAHAAWERTLLACFIKIPPRPDLAPTLVTEPAHKSNRLGGARFQRASA
jgi:hypothetical protein